jgi:hypothetical protein
MTSRQRNALIIVAAIGLAFGGGSAWQFAKARQARLERDSAQQELAAAEQQLALERLEATLAIATVAAQLGNFERGRQLASDFFTRLQESAAGAPPAASAGFAEILARRDALITALSRSEPESGLELARLLASFQGALGKEAASPAPLRPAAPPAGADTGR